MESAPWEPEGPQTVQSYGPGWSLKDILSVAILIVIAALIRLPFLSQPPGIVFDEAYYARDSCLYLGIGQEACNAPQATEQTYVHPPLGKWLISVGIKMFGYNAFGWRVMAAVFGILLVPLVYTLARRLFRDRFIGFVAGLLVATDFLLIVQSRIAMLDIFLAFFVTLGFFFLAMDRERLIALRENFVLPFPGDPPRRDPEWRFAAGAAFGMALAVKWSAGLAVAAAGVMAVFWSTGYVRDLRAKQKDWEEGPETAQMYERTGRLLGREYGSAAVAFLVVPLVIYLLSYSLWFKDNVEREHCTSGVDPVCESGFLATGKEFVDLQRSIFDYHIGLDATHPYESRAWTWPLVMRPVAYYYTGPPSTPSIHHIVAMGNPIVWWAALLALIWLAIRSFRKWRPERFVLVAWLAQYLPWLLIGRPLFIFYMTPVVPFMMIGLAGAIGSLKDLARPMKWTVIAYLVIAAGLLTLYFYPVLTGGGLTQDLWNSRMWFRGGCDDTSSSPWCWI